MIKNDNTTLTPASSWRTHALTSLAVFAVFLDTTILVVAFPSIRRSFSQVSTAEISWVLNAYNLTFAALLVAAGRLSDQFGRKRFFLAGLAVFTGASALCGIAPSAGTLIAARGFQAIGGAILMPTSLALVLAAFPLQKRAVAVTLWGAVGGLAAATGPSLGSLIIQTLGWRWAFYINLPIGLAGLLAGRKVLVESRDTTARGWPDFVGAVMLAVAVALLTFGILGTQAWGWTAVQTPALLLVSLLLLGAFIARSRTVSSPALDLSLFSDGNYRLSNLGLFFFAIGFNAMFLSNVLFLTQVWHYSTLLAGVAITPAPLTVIPVAILAGRLATKFGHRVLIVPGGVITALAALMMLFRAGPEPAYLSVWIPSSLCVGIGVGLCLPVLASAAVQSLPPNRFAIGSAVNQSIRQVGAVLGVALALTLLGGRTTALTRAAFDPVFILCAVAGLLTSAASFGLRTRMEGRARPEKVAEAVQVMPQEAAKVFRN
jgi:EmrB/QacA subfamily drug resistance transporter